MLVWLVSASASVLGFSLSSIAFRRYEPSRRLARFGRLVYRHAASYCLSLVARFLTFHFAYFSM